MSTALTYEQALQALTTAATDPVTLQTIANTYPALHPQILAHPQCYPALAEWIASQTPVLPVVQTPPSIPSATATQTGRMPLGATSAVAVPAVMPATTSVATTAGGSKKAFLIAGLAVGAVAVVGVGGALAYNTILGGDGGVLDSASALPASAAAVVELSIEPSTAQKLTMAQVYMRLEGTTEYIWNEVDSPIYLEIDPQKLETDLRPYLWEAIVDGADLDTGLSYDRDVNPWIGSRLAAALVGITDEGTPGVIVAVETRNDDLGIAAVEEFLDDVEVTGVEVDVRNGYVLIYSEDLDLDDLYADGVLSDQPSYKSTVPELGDRGLATIWSSPHAMATLQMEMEDSSDWGNPDFYEDALELVDPADGVAVVVRAVSEGLDVVGVNSFAFLKDTAVDTHAGQHLGALPDTTAVALSVLGMGTFVDLGLSDVAMAYGMSGQTTPMSPTSLLMGGGYGYGDFDDAASELEEAREAFEDAVGLTVPEELDEAIGAGLTLVLDEDLGCDPGDYNDECEDINVAALLHGPDLDLAEGAVEDLADAIAEESYDATKFTEMIDMEQSESGAYLVIGRGDYVDTLTTKPSATLSSLSEFKQALPQAKNAHLALFVRTEGIMSMLKDFGVKPDKNVRAVIDDFSAVGYTAYLEKNGLMRSHFRIVVAE